MLCRGNVVAAASAHLGSGAARLDRLAVVDIGATQATELMAATPFAVVVVIVAGRRGGPLAALLLLVAAAGCIDDGYSGVADEAGPGERLGPAVHPRGADVGEVERVVRRRRRRARSACCYLPPAERRHRRPRRPPVDRGRRPRPRVRSLRH